MKEFFRIELEITYDPETQTYRRDELKLHWRKPLPHNPWLELGTDTIKLSEHPELKDLIEGATALAVPIANAMGNTPETASQPEL